MKNIIKILLVLVLVFSISFFNRNITFGQNLNIYRNTHSKLLANQERIQDRFDWNTIQTTNFERTSPIFNEYWNNVDINPYVNTIPIIGTKINIMDYVNPVKTNKINSHYGYRASFGRLHCGVDLEGRTGDTIYAAFTGRVRLTKFDRAGYGFFVIIRHNNGLETLYGHMTKFLVKNNDHVDCGQPIGLVGSTGRSTGSHLHFEIRYMGHNINPENMIDFTTHTPRMGTYTYDGINQHNNRNNIASSRTKRNNRRRR